jgi:uncharacterized coiled-coil DUF342 family protein
MPSLKISKILIQAKLFNENGVLSYSQDLALQFFNPESNKWQATGQKLNVKEGILNIELDISKPNTNAYLFYEAVLHGVIPVCRLILYNSIKSRITEIVSTGVKTDYSNSEVILDFGNNYKLPQDIIDGLVLVENELAKRMYIEIPLNFLLKDTEEVQKKIDALNLTTENDKAKINLLTESLNEAKSSLKKLDESYRILENDNIKLKENINKYVKESDAVNKRYEEATYKLKERISHIENEKILLNDTIKKNNERIKVLTDSINIRSQELETKGKSITELNMEIQKLNDKIEEMKEERPDYEPKSQPVSKVYSGILNEFKQIKDANSDNPYKLSNISLNLKTFVEHDENGIRLQLVDARKLSMIDPNLLSVVNVDLGDAEQSNHDKVRVPFLVGLTETASRKILNSLGLQLKAIYEFRDNIPEGQAFKQSPAAGDILPNETITLIFSKTIKQ